MNGSISAKNKTEWPRRTKEDTSCGTDREEDREEQGGRGEDGDRKREMFEGRVFLIWKRLFTVGLPGDFHERFMYNLT